MNKSSGIWIEIGGGSVAEAVLNSIERHGAFTTTAAAGDIAPRSAELAIVSLYGSPDYIGVSQSGKKSVTGQMTLAVSNLIPVKGLTKITLQNRLPSRFAKRASFPEVGAYRPTPRLWDEIFRVVSASLPDSKTQVGNLQAKIRDSQRPLHGTRGGLELFERDAVASALEAWAGPAMRKMILRESAAPIENPTASFLTRLRTVTVREDLQIIHDQATFPGFEIARRDIVGSVLLRNADGEYLTIVNCNRQPLEETLGVDLIYYSHRFDSFVLVQYKRMTDSDRGFEYRPASDATHDRELQRMARIDRILEKSKKPYRHSPNTFRLLERPFYLKLAAPYARAALDPGLVPGMYVPLELWKRILRSKAVRGQRGGVVINWENCPRRFSNSDFTRLLRQGWIGSSASESKQLAEIIEGVLANKQMVVFAATSAGKDPKDYRRDTLGRFALEDDPLATF